MKKTRTLIAVLLLLCTAALMFMPIASFEDRSADAMLEDIAKLEGKLEREVAKLERDTAAGKDQAALDKQKGKVEKAQAAVDEKKAEYEAASGASGAGLSYAMLPNKLPEEIKLDMEVINANAGVYPTDFSMHYGLMWAAFALLVVAAALLVMGKNQLVSKCYTFSSFANLAAVLMIGYGLLRIKAIPVKLPYGAASMNPILCTLILVLPIIALFLNCTALINTKRSMIYTLCIALSALSILPFWLMIVNATRNSTQIQSGVSLLPSTFLDHNISVLKTKDFQVLTGFKNSAIIAFGSTLMSVYFSALTAYGFVVYKFKGNKFLWSVVMAIIMIPGQVTATGFFMFMYKLGWNISIASTIGNIALAVVLIFVGALVYKEVITTNHLIGIGLCIIGLVVMNR